MSGPGTSRARTAAAAVLPAVLAAVLALGLAGGCAPQGLVYEGEGLTARLRTEPWPPRARVETAFQVEFGGPGAAGVTAGELHLQLAMPEMGHGATALTLRRIADARYRGAARIDHGGFWEARVLDPDGKTLARFQLEVGP